MKKRLIAIFLTITILASLYILNEKYRPFEPGKYDFFVLYHRLLNWNLRELDEYPEHMIIYVRSVWESDVRHYYAGVYPSLDENLEKKIRALGYPYNCEFVHFEGNDRLGAKNIDDSGYFLDEDYILSPDAEVHDWSYRTFKFGKRSLIHRLLYNPHYGEY